MDSLDKLLLDLNHTYDRLISSVWEAENISANLERMALSAEKLEKSLVTVGDFCHKELEKIANQADDNQLYKYLWFNFVWADLAKELLLLWRDILFQYHKGHIIRIDGLTSDQSLRDFNHESFTAIQQAIKDFKEDTKQGLGVSAIQKKKQIAIWRLQTNPWEIYKKQLQAIASQCRRLQEDFRLILNAGSIFNEIETLVYQTEKICKEEIQSVEKVAQQTISEIDKEALPKLSRIANYLEDLETRINLPNHFNVFTDSLDYKISRLVARREVPINTEGGSVEVKELDIRKSAKQWLDAEILPLLYEVWELTENAHNGLKMALINIKNRAILLSAEEKEGKTLDITPETICLPLISFSKNLGQTNDSTQKILDLIHERLTNQFNLSAIYHLDQEFLPIGLQSTIRQLRRGQNEVQNRFIRWLQHQWQYFQNLQANAKEEDSLSHAEKIVRLIKNRTGEESNSNYASIFLTKGFIGDSFAVGRSKELAHAKGLVQNWKMGFRGSLAITGQRFAGKTLLGELIANQFFANRTVRLAPNSLIRLNGRRMTTSFDLEAALEFIRKYASNTPPLIWIDDLELWKDSNLPLSQNVRALRKYIDNYSHRLFFMVSMSNWLKSHLNFFHETSKVFQAEINVDKMEIDEIQEAIMIRHGATHKQLVDSEGEIVNNKQFQKIINGIYRITQGNIGETLNRWSSATRKIDEETVSNNSGLSYSLPDFLTPESAIILTSIMMEKRTNEYRLRKAFGPAFTDKYKPIIQRLISIGLLNRQLDDWLEINELVVNDLGQLLETKGYLTFYH